MLKLYIFVFLGFVFSFVKAQSDSISINKRKQAKELIKRFEIPDSDTIWKTKSLENKWTYLSESVSGCLVGGEYCNDSKCGDMGCCLNINPYWIDFLKFTKDSLTQFLISKLHDTTQTKTHTCPFFLANKGELATYCLQHILKMNWYDLDKSYQKYVNGELEPMKDYYSLQQVLQSLLKDKKELNNLTRYWLEIIKK